MAAEKRDGVALAALLLALFGTAHSLYVTHARGPKLGVFVGPEVLLMGRQHIGLLCTFTNSGSQTGVIAAMKIVVAGENAPLRAVWTAARPDEFKLTPSGQMPGESGSYVYFAPLGVEPQSQLTRTVWFYRETPWLPENVAGEKSVTLTAFESADKVAATSEFRVSIDEEAERCLSRFAKGPVAYVECPALVAGWSAILGPG